MGKSVYLDTMRTGVEGIVPNFNKEITEYFLMVDSSINELNITAMPENANAKVNIYGDTKLKIGMNKVIIEVTSEDETEKNNYTINITKTLNIEKANTNLTTLAVEHFSIEPPFSSDNLQYNVKVSSTIETINIFAIPEGVLANISIKNKDSLDFGENEIIITVTAENGITFKNYMLKVYRMNEEEEVSEIREKVENNKKLNNILETYSTERQINQSEIVNNSFMYVLPEIVLGLLFGLLIGYTIFNKYLTKKFKK